MGRKAIDYSTREIIFYRYVCNDPNIFNPYVSSTIDMTRQKGINKLICNDEDSTKHNLLAYKIIRENGGWNNWRMLEIERMLVKDKTEIATMEQYWMEHYNILHREKQLPAKHNKI